MSNKQIESTVVDATASVPETESIQIPKVQLIELLNKDQINALVSKWALVDPIIRTDTEEKFPGVDHPAELFILRSMVKVANAANASMLRPGYIERAKMWTRSLVSVVASTREEAHKEMRKIADEVDVAEAKKICKAVKIKLDMDSKNPAIVTLCGIFGIDPATIS